MNLEVLYNIKSNVDNVLYEIKKDNLSYYDLLAMKESIDEIVDGLTKVGVGEFVYRKDLEFKAGYKELSKIQSNIERKSMEVIANWNKKIMRLYKKIVKGKEKIDMIDVNMLDYHISKEIDGIELYNAIKDDLKKVIDFGIIDAREDIEKVTKFYLYPEEAIRWLEDRGTTMIKNVSDTQREQIKEILIKGIEEGFTIRDISIKIEEVLGDIATKYKASRIAHTEVMTAFNQAKLETYKQYGRTKKKWLNGGARACENCIELHGRIIDITDLFRVGGIEKNAPPLHPNCICSLGTII